MENKNKSLTLFISLSCVLIYSIYNLNTITEIYQCALMFSIIAFISNIIHNLFGKTLLMAATAISCLGAYGIFWNVEYSLNGKIITGLITTSIISIFTSCGMGAVIFKILPKTYTFKTKNFLSMVATSTTDGVIMATFFLTKYKFSRVLYIFKKELTYKIIFSAIIVLILYILENLVLAMYKKNMVRTKKS